MHASVMAEEVRRVLVTNRNGVYVDLNVGDGGHARTVCDALGDGDYRYVGMDKDPRSLATARQRLADFGPRVTLLLGDHGDFATLLDPADRGVLDGILFDLGFSSSQLDDPGRGFSYDTNGPLDMRYDPESPSAASLLETMSEDALRESFLVYGNVSGAARLARAIVARRRTNPLKTTRELCALAEDALRPTPPRRRKVLSQIFQTLRVLVNDEVESFRRALADTHAWLKPGGVLCIIAYESVTDRLAKRHFHPRDRDKDAFGNPIQPLLWDRLTRRASRPTEAEIAANPRARSARLRAGAKRAVEA